MRHIFVSLSLAVGAMLVGVSLALAQSGVLSGPPQATPGGPPGPPNNYGAPSQPPSNFASPPVEPEQRGGGAWIAVAAGFDGRGKNVSVGFSGTRSSRIDAENAALNVCNGRSRGVSCTTAYAVTAGCLYIVPGSGRRGVTWGRGSTPDVALQECRRDGYACDRGRVIGGCVPGFN
jgi:hypothetical protein